jgi:hypothetical protein
MVQQAPAQNLEAVVMRYEEGNLMIVNVATKLLLFREPSRSRDRRRGRQYGTVAGDEPPLEQHQFAWRMGGDGLRNAAGRDRKWVDT